MLSGLFFGLVNYFVWEFRGSPVVVTDLASIGTAVNVAGGYDYTLDRDCIYSILYALAFLSMVLKVKSYRGPGWKKRIAVAGGFVCFVVCFYLVFFKSTYLKDNGIKGDIFNGTTYYAQNGSALSFVISWTYYVVEKPQGYSAKAVEAIADNYSSDEQGADASAKPNIIVIMNETFADLNVVGEVASSEDAMPFVHGLSENTVKGNLHVSVFGGTTANTEFEFLTGADMNFLPYRSTPYNSYIKQALPTLNTVLTAQGYGGNIALHPFEGNGWKRKLVYPLLGFSEFLCIDDLTVSEEDYVRAFVSDERDFEQVISEYEKHQETNSESPFYLFNVTIQNHGGYDSSSMKEEDMVITITDEKQRYDQAETYLNLIRKSDKAFEQLVSYFENVEEPTLLVMFGDHLPGLPRKFYRALYGKSLDALTIEELSREYQVPYVIWANYDIEEEQRDMSVNYLGAYVLKTAGAKLSGFQKYLLELMEKVPVLTQICYVGDDGVVREPEEKSEYTELIEEYAKIQYNYLFDRKNRVEEFFSLQ